MSLYGWIKGQGPSGFGANSTAEEVTAGLDLSGRRYLITGSNSGIGLETARVLALRGATVLAAARSEQKAAAAVAGLPGDFVPLACELEDPASVRACVATVREQGAPLDGIITNAGIMALPQRELVLGFEKQFFVNHVGHFLLVTELLDALKDNARVVALSSTGHKQAPREGIRLDDLAAEGSYRPFSAYGQSKLANLLFARELSRRFAGGERVACAVHPGVINTNLVRNMQIPALLKPVLALLPKTIPQGAATQVWAAVRAEPSTVDGQYLADCNVAKSSARGQDLELAGRLWTRTEEILGTL